MRLCDNVGGCDNTPAPAVLLLEPNNEPGSTRKSCHRLGSLHAQKVSAADRSPGFCGFQRGSASNTHTLGDDCAFLRDSDKKFTVRVLIECDSSVEKLKIVTVRPTSNDNCEWSCGCLGAAGCPVAYPRRAQCAPGCARCARLGRQRSRSNPANALPVPPCPLHPFLLRSKPGRATPPFTRGGRKRKGTARQLGATHLSPPPRAGWQSLCRSAGERVPQTAATVLHASAARFITVAHRDLRCRRRRHRRVQVANADQRGKHRRASAPRTD